MTDFIIQTGQFTDDLDTVERSIPSYTSPALQDLVKRQEFSINFRAQKAGEEILVQGEITGEIALDCSRCLEDFKYPVRLSITQSYPAESETINVEDEVRELLILNLPVQPLCKEDCAGLCAHCGKDLNAGHCGCKEETLPGTGPWDKLKNIIKK